MRFSAIYMENGLKRMVWRRAKRQKHGMSSTRIIPALYSRICLLVIAVNTVHSMLYGKSF